MSKLATVETACGRAYLSVAGIVVAVQGDVCRDPDVPNVQTAGWIHGMGWTIPMLEFAAAKINEALKENEGTTCHGNRKVTTK